MKELVQQLNHSTAIFINEHLIGSVARNNLVGEGGGGEDWKWSDSEWVPLNLILAGGRDRDRFLD